MEIEVRQAYNDIDAVKELFCEYTTWLGMDLSFQNYNEELDSLPGKYAPPMGRLYIALCDGDIAGCVAVRPFDDGRCELKRLYIRPRFRGLGLAGMLTRQAIDDSKSLKYKKMLLDTRDTMESANALYRKLGFYTIDPYYHNPYPGINYYCLDLI